MRVLWIAIVLVAAGCAQNHGPDSTLTEHQRDSVLAKSRIIPGGAAVGRAMSEADAESQRGTEMQSQIDSLPH